MSARCPRPCGRLVTAAIFVSVGVVQFIVGLILLRSKYVYLLSAPNFWTAISNLAVGCVLGVSASVWKNTRKSSPKHTARRNVLAALVVSAIFLNSATAVILILGEGNTLLSIRLESDGKHSSTTIANEILAYSYATSVCSPVVCVVVAVTYLSGIWFRRSDMGGKTPEIKSILKKESIDDYNWVFKEKHDLLKKDPRMVKALSFKSLSSCSDDESPYSRFRSHSGRLQEYSDASLRRSIERTPNDRQVLQNPTRECGEHAHESAHGNTLHESIRYSLVDEGSAKRINPQNNSPFIYRKHTNTNDQFHSDECRSGDGGNSVIYAEPKSNNQYLEDLKMQSRRKRMLFNELSPFQRSEIFQTSENKENMQSYRACHDEARNKLNFSVNSSDVEADVHMDSSSFNDPELSIYESHELSPNETIVIYEDNTSSPNNRGNAKKTNDLDTSIQLSSSYRRLSHPDISYLDENKHNSGFAKVHRTSTTANMSISGISQFDILDIEIDSDVINQHTSYNLDEVTKTAMSNSKHSRRPDTSQIDSTTEVDNNDSTETPMLNRLSGEIITVRLNSISGRPLHPRLVPVSIPTVSDKENPLSRRKILHTSLVTDQTVKKDGNDTDLQESDKFSNKKEAFSSFRGELKVKNKEKHRSKSAGEYSLGRVDKKYKKIYEIFPDDNNTTSPANTSGYNSAFEESINDLYSSSFKPNVSVSSSSIHNEDNISTYHTPMKMQWADSSPETSQTLPKSPEMVTRAGIVNRIIEESSETNSNKELIAHLLNEVSLEKVAQGH